MSTSSKPTLEELQTMCEEAMEDNAVTNISGWTEPNSDTSCDENAYRKRLCKNASVFNEKITEALKFE